MTSRSYSPSIPLPRGWTKVVNVAVLHAISVVSTALTAAWGRAANRSSRTKDRAEIDRLRMELSLLKDLSKDDAIAEELVPEPGRVVTAKRPNHVWNADLTIVPTGSGFWVPWLPFAMAQRWPFCWWIAIAMDHYSRLVVGFALFTRQPTSEQVCVFLDRAIRKAGRKPKHIITDRGKQFDCEAFREWCKGRTIRPRYGAVGKHGSIAIIETVLRSMKSECTTRIIVPLGLTAMRRELALYAAWYNEHRPHAGLGGRTPLEVYRNLPPGNEAPRFEPRARWLRGSPCARPVVPVMESPGVKLALVLRNFEDRGHLPVIELKRAA